MVDTSVWVDHFRNHNQTLDSLLHQNRVLVHPLVIGEIACGTPPAPRAQTLNDLSRLPATAQASLSDTIALIDREALYGAGCGLIDMLLLASTLITPGARLWTLDKHLASIAKRLNVSEAIKVP
ncbi:PIN domain-containing protein [Duganella sp. FT80W]|uniref:PIN domain-containing protein n=1 Tax=Duganella guangzhouensis TaxID=2666084 RepID=A0A6I2KVC0_9BURK|nr:PIN domain-containing protein [Duganella guangzhouensis]MRW89878.1 PIN domain-containing protein [Duganella guangzhouensis]